MQASPTPMFLRIHQFPPLHSLYLYLCKMRDSLYLQLHAMMHNVNHPIKNFTILIETSIVDKVNLITKYLHLFYVHYQRYYS